MSNSLLPSMNKKSRRNELFEAPTEFNPPCATLYINNLNDKINADRLKEVLTIQFEQYGDIKSVVCMKSFWRRGQAYITYSNVESATTALEKLQGFTVFGKPIRINYAKEVSTASLRKKTDEAGPKRESANPRRPPGISKQAAELLLELAEEAAERYPAPPGDEHVTLTLQPRATPGLGSGQVTMSSLQTRSLAPVGPVSGPAPPAPRLLLKGLPPSATDASVRSLFMGAPGLLNVRVVASHNVAFVEFETTHHATYAMGKSGQRLMMDSYEVAIDYAR